MFNSVILSISKVCTLLLIMKFQILDTLKNLEVCVHSLATDAPQALSPPCPVRAYLDTVSPSGREETLGMAEGARRVEAMVSLCSHLESFSWFHPRALLLNGIVLMYSAPSAVLQKHDF